MGKQTKKKQRAAAEAAKSVSTYKQLTAEQEADRLKREQLAAQDYHYRQLSLARNLRAYGRILFEAHLTAEQKKKIYSGDVTPHGYILKLKRGQELSCKCGAYVPRNCVVVVRGTLMDLWSAPGARMVCYACALKWVKTKDDYYYKCPVKEQFKDKLESYQCRKNSPCQVLHMTQALIESEGSLGQ